MTCVHTSPSLAIHIVFAISLYRHFPFHGSLRTSTAMAGVSQSQSSSSVEPQTAVSSYIYWLKVSVLNMMLTIGAVIMRPANSASKFHFQAINFQQCITKSDSVIIT